MQEALVVRRETHIPAPPAGVFALLTDPENPTLDGNDLAQRSSYSSWRRHQTPVSLRPLGARSSHWYMPQRPSSPRA
jgi:hypothetical protein